MKFSLLFLLLFLFCYSQAQPADTLMQWKSTRIEGNKRTKNDIILREFDLVQDSTYSFTEIKSRLQQTRKNLLNLQLFNFVTITADSIIQQPDSSYHFRINVKLVERWFRWPVPILELGDRNFNQWWLNKDPARLNYGFLFIDNNMRGRNEYLKLKFQVGYTQKYELTYEVPYLNKKKKLGAALNLLYATNRETGYNTISDTLRFFRDPQNLVLKRWQSYLTLFYRPGLFGTHTLQVGWHKLLAADSLIQLNPDFLGNLQQQKSFASLQYIYTYNRTNLISYPTTGNWMQTRLQFLQFYGQGNSQSILNAQLHLGNYFHLWGLHYSYCWISAGASFSKQPLPYYFRKALGYDRFVRGYEYRVIDGEAYAMAAFGYRLNVLPVKVIRLPFLPLPQFNRIPIAIYSNYFSDWGYVKSSYADGNSLPNNLLLSAGVGLDIVTYYDKVLRIEYALTKDGSKGLFVHFNALF